MKTRRPASSSNASTAFTLLEILLATAIFAVILAAINTAFYGAVKLQSRSKEAMDQFEIENQAVAIMKNDLRAMVAPGGVLAGSITGTTEGSSSGQNANLDFYAANGITDTEQSFGDIRRITYYLGKTISTRNAYGKDLIRASSRNLLSQIEETPEEQVLLSGIEALEIQYCDGTNWVQTWDPTVQTNAPRALEVLLTHARDNFSTIKLDPQPIQFTVLLSIQARASSTNSTSGTGGTGGTGGSGTRPTGGGQ